MGIIVRLSLKVEILMAGTRSVAITLISLTRTAVDFAAHGEDFTCDPYEIRDPLLAYNPNPVVHIKRVLISSEGFSHAQQ